MVKLYKASSLVEASLIPLPTNGASLTFPTVTMKSSVADNEPSEAVARKVTLPISAVAGVPLSVLVPALKLNPGRQGRPVRFGQGIR